MQAITLDVIMAGIFGVEDRPARGTVEHRLRGTIKHRLRGTIKHLVTMIPAHGTRVIVRRHVP